MTALERGQEFLDGFKKLPYSTDRIGQSFIMKASVASKPTPKEDVLKTLTFTVHPSNSPQILLRLFVECYLMIFTPSYTI